MKLRIRAAGKLMLAGEYAVLRREGVALAVAVPHGVIVEAQPASSWSLVRGDDDISWREGEPVPEALRFVHQALELSRQRDPSLGPQRLKATSTGTVGSGAAKPGVGGSASATVATLWALAEAGSGAPPEELLARALEAHRGAQGGRGSGYDVATILCGGLCAYRRRGDDLPLAERHRWPSGYTLLAGYSGKSASTRVQLEKVAALHGDDEAALDSELAALGAPVEGLLAALEGGDGVTIRDGCDACHGVLAAWDRRHALGIVTPAITALLTTARELGVAAKVAGAGAGDSAWALSDDPQRLEALAAAWRRQGFVPYPMPIAEEGVELEAALKP